MGTKLRAALCRAICAKAQRVDRAACGATLAEIANLLAVDANNIMTFGPPASWLFLEGVQLACTLGVLYWILGPAALGGLGVTLVTLPLNAVVMRLIKAREESTPRRAARSRSESSS